MKRARFTGSNETIQVGGLNTDSSVLLAADTASSAFAADTIIEVFPTSGDVYVQIGTSPSAPSKASGNGIIPYGGYRPFRIDSGNKIMASGEIMINVVN